MRLSISSSSFTALSFRSRVLLLSTLLLFLTFVWIFFASFLLPSPTEELSPSAHSINQITILKSSDASSQPSFVRLKSFENVRHSVFLTKAERILSAEQSNQTNFQPSSSNQPIITNRHHDKQKIPWKSSIADNHSLSFNCSSLSPLLLSASPLSWYNDGYCDCQDGSDEPLTAACSLIVPPYRGGFLCVDSSNTNERVPYGRIEDGVCDCSNCSDEKKRN
jgi:hypothetical protein